jgi:DNA-binding Lrp family transcriptional regulator
MKLQAFVLINITKNDAKQIIAKLRGLQAVKAANAVTGPYDIIAVVEADDLDKLTTLIAQEIHAMEGIERTLSCLVLTI